MSAASGAVAAARMRAERHIVQALRSAGATSPESAIALPEGRVLRRSAMRKLLRREAVVPAGELFWLDETAYREMRELRRSRLFMILFGLAALLIVVAAVTIAKS